MKLLFRLTVLALAAVGARTLFERVRPRIENAGETGNRVVGETLTPAFRDAAATVKDASAQAAHEVVDAAREATDEVRDAAPTPAVGVPQPASPGTSP